MPEEQKQDEDPRDKKIRDLERRVSELDDAVMYLARYVGIALSDLADRFNQNDNA